MKIELEFHEFIALQKAASEHPPQWSKVYDSLMKVGLVQVSLDKRLEMTDPEGAWTAVVTNFGRDILSKLRPYIFEHQINAKV